MSAQKSVSIAPFLSISPQQVLHSRAHTSRAFACPRRFAAHALQSRQTVGVKAPGWLASCCAARARWEPVPFLFYRHFLPRRGLLAKLTCRLFLVARVPVLPVPHCLLHTSRRRGNPQSPTSTMLRELRCSCKARAACMVINGAQGANESFLRGLRCPYSRSALLLGTEVP